jgi:hypothetical protein
LRLPHRASSRFLAAKPSGSGQCLGRYHSCFFNPAIHEKNRRQRRGVSASHHSMADVIAGVSQSHGIFSLVSGGVLTSKSKSEFRTLFFLGMLLAGPSVAAHSQSSETIFLVRHAEKTSTARDATLSPQGRKRAECLAHTLGDAGIQSFSPQDLSAPRKPRDP